MDQMADAARENDWDLLESLELEVAALRDQIKTNDRTGICVEGDETQRQRKRELILRMLANDREIRRHTEPWMANVRALLAGSAATRTLRKAYGSEH